jgi:hypothetical protein
MWHNEKYHNVFSSPNLSRVIKWRAFRFHKILGNSFVAERLLASQEGLGSMELVSWLVGYTALKCSATISNILSGDVRQVTK